MFINTIATHKTDIILPYGELKPIIEWCERNCSGEWGFSEAMDTYSQGYTFYFESEKDFVTFLVWKK